MADEVLISWLTNDGAEHDETWPTVDAFRCWAEAEGWHVAIGRIAKMRMVIGWK